MLLRIKVQDQNETNHKGALVLNHEVGTIGQIKASKWADFRAWAKLAELAVGSFLFCLVYCCFYFTCKTKSLSGHSGSQCIIVPNCWWLFQLCVHVYGHPCVCSWIFWCLISFKTKVSSLKIIFIMEREDSRSLLCQSSLNKTTSRQRIFFL